MITYYTEKDLVSFGLYLLSKERTELIEGDKHEVYHADLMNWKVKEEEINTPSAVACQ
jgi:hypothetical protein